MILSPLLWTMAMKVGHMASAFIKTKEVLPRRQQRRTFWAESVYLKNKHFCSNAFTARLISDYSKKHPNLIKLVYFLIHFCAHTVQKPGVCLLSSLHLTGVILSRVLAVRGWCQEFGLRTFSFQQCGWLRAEILLLGYSCEENSLASVWKAEKLLVALREKLCGSASRTLFPLF